MDKREQIDMTFENDLFSQEDVDNINEKVENNICKLLDIQDYLQINKKFHEITLQLTSSLSSNQRKLLNEYQGLELEITSYQNCLAYYLGCKAVIENNKLK